MSGNAWVSTYQNQKKGQIYEKVLGLGENLVASAGTAAALSDEISATGSQNGVWLIHHHCCRDVK